MRSSEICSANAWFTREGADAAAAEQAAPLINFLLVIERLTKSTDIIFVLLIMGFVPNALAY